MNDSHAILQNIPHEKIQNASVSTDERFDIFKLGTFKIDQSLIEEIVELVELQQNTQYKPHYHEKSSAVIYMILGEGMLILGHEIISYQPGQRFDIPAKKLHGFITKTKTLFLSIQSPPIYNRETQTVDLHYADE